MNLLDGKLVKEEVIKGADKLDISITALVTIAIIEKLCRMQGE